MRIILENNLCEDRPYINLKKLPIRTSIRVGSANDLGLKSTYIIDQHTQSLCKNDNYISEYNNGNERLTYDTEELNEMLLVEVNYSSRSGDSSAKFKVYVILNNIKYALPFGSFEDIYKNCMDILNKELTSKEDLTYIKAGFKNLDKEEKTVDINLNLERLAEFKDRADYKRNVDYFVVRNLTSSISKYDINNKVNKIEITDRVKVLRYDYIVRLYSLVNTNSSNIVTLKDTDIICDLGDENNYPTVSIYTEYGLGKLLDIKNNVIPTNTTLSLFANILDLGFDVLG
ncbi:hypothetical protein [Clostridium sp.]|uniref:hypothetical protein n=1 Tax=Clostridium sp. TaxID=1506 RepID=UPI002FCB0C1D